MKKRWIWCAGLLLAHALNGCTVTPQVFSDFDGSQSFTDYQTFAWISDQPMTVAGSRGPSPIVAERLEAAIKDTLQSKGYRFVTEKEQADFVVSFTVGARDQLQIREREVIDYYGPHWRWGYDYFGVVYPRGFPRTEVTTRQYVEGSLAIDIFDTERRSPVWHGSASKRLSPAEQQGASAESIREGVAAILAEFPPETGSPGAGD